MDSKDFYAKCAAIAAVVILLLAPLDWPYGYYRLLRVVVAFSGLSLAYLASTRQERWLCVTLVAVVLIFNPLVPLGLEREQWTVLNLLAAGVFVWALLRVSNAPAIDRDVQQ